MVVPAVEILCHQHQVGTCGIGQDRLPVGCSGLVLFELLVCGGWGNAVALSPLVAQLLVVLAAVAFVLTLLLVLVLGISFWASDPGTRRLEARLAAPPHEPPHDDPAA